ncbi:MAG: hypothetical protein MI919_20015, partial [Holophagales bacterium]|nr:hypothetical protein [Holophagales bacterium]
LVAEGDGAAGRLRGQLTAPFAPDEPCLWRTGWARDNGSERLLLAAHPLLLDPSSWRLLAGDLLSVARLAQRGEVPALPPKDDSFQAWSQAMTGVEPRPATVAGAALPRAETGAEASVASVDLPLVSDTVDALAGPALEAYSNRPVDFLLAALLEALAPWVGSRTLVLDLEVPARDSAAGLDARRTLGRFDVPAALVIDFANVTGHREMLQAMKESVRVLPRRPAAAVAEIAFGNSLAAELVGPAGEPLADRVASGPWLAAPVLGPHLLRFDAGMTPGGAALRCAYRADLFRRASIEGLLVRFDEALTELVGHCRAPTAGGYTPSDFPEAELDQDDLDRFVSMLTE